MRAGGDMIASFMVEGVAEHDVDAWFRYVRHILVAASLAAIACGLVVYGLIGKTTLVPSRCVRFVCWPLLLALDESNLIVSKTCRVPCRLRMQDSAVIGSLRTRRSSLHWRQRALLRILDGRGSNALKGRSSRRLVQGQES